MLRPTVRRHIRCLNDTVIHWETEMRTGNYRDRERQFQRGMGLCTVSLRR
jgi:hypothetical protein